MINFWLLANVLKCDCAICITAQVCQTESVVAIVYLLLHICHYILLYTRYDVKHCHYYVMCWFVACIQHSVLPRTRVCNGCVYDGSETNKKIVVIVFESWGLLNTVGECI